MERKVALEEHLTTALNNSLWNASGEAARNGKAYMADVDLRLLDIEQRISDELSLLGVLRRPLREPPAILPGRNGEVPFERSAHVFLVTEAATSRYALDALLGFLEQTPCGLDPE
jgi:hypothetical protein